MHICVFESQVQCPFLRSSIKHVDPEINITELYILKKNY